MLLVLRLRRGVVKGPPAAPVRIMPARRWLRRPVRRPTSIVAAPAPAPAPAPPATAVLVWVRGLWLVQPRLPAIVRFLIPVPAAAPAPTIVVRARRVFAAPPAPVAHVHLMARVHRDLPKCPLREAAGRRRVFDDVQVQHDVETRTQRGNQMAKIAFSTQTPNSSFPAKGSLAFPPPRPFGSSGGRVLSLRDPWVASALLPKYFAIGVLVKTVFQSCQLAKNATWPTSWPTFPQHSRSRRSRRSSGGAEGRPGREPCGRACWSSSPRR